MANLPPAKASITQMSLSSSCLRVHLKPLLEEAPFVGACTISFLRPPDFDFDLDGLGNALAIPGVSFLLRHVIQDQLEQTIVMPNSLTISLVPNLLDNSKRSVLRKEQPSKEMSYSVVSKEIANSIVSIPSGVLNVNIVEAKGLENRDVAVLGQGKSDPYAILRIVSDGETSTFKTHVVNNNLHPVWNMAVDLPVDNPESLEGTSVYYLSNHCRMAL